MIYLEKKQFLPAFIFTSLIFIPIITVISFLIFYIPQRELLTTLAIVILVYFGVVMIFYILSRSHKWYLKIENGRIEIKYPNINKGKHRLSISVTKISHIEYYSLTSFKSWLLILSYIFPKAVYMTYIIDGKMIKDRIGYMDYLEVKQISKDNNIPLVVY